LLAKGGKLDSDSDATHAENVQHFIFKKGLIRRYHERCTMKKKPQSSSWQGAEGGNQNTQV
jgi:hypothetical protein